MSFSFVNWFEAPSLHIRRSEVALGDEPNIGIGPASAIKSLFRKLNSISYSDRMLAPAEPCSKSSQRVLALLRRASAGEGRALVIVG
jgi:hypothetical protein